VAPIPRKYVVVYGLLFVPFLAFAIVDAIAIGGWWIGIIVQTGRSLEPLAIVAAPLSYAVVEVREVLAEVFLKKREEKGRREILDRLERDKVITPDKRRELEQEAERRDK
jgi:hypothetical protein